MSNPVLSSLHPWTEGGTSTGSDDLEVPTDATPTDWQDVFEDLGCSLTRIVDPMTDPNNPQLPVRSVLGLICPDRPGRLAKASRLLHEMFGANIVSSFGGRMDNDIHGSYFTIMTSPSQAERILHEVQMHQCNQIKVGDPPNRDNVKIYELSITARDRPCLFSDITGLLVQDNLNINILSYGILTKESTRSPGNPFAQIDLRLEVPLETVPRLPGVIDEIRNLGREEGWYVVDRGEWTGGPGFSRVPIMGLEHLN